MLAKSMLDKARVVNTLSANGSDLCPVFSKEHMNLSLGCPSKTYLSTNDNWSEFEISGFDSTITEKYLAI